MNALVNATSNQTMSSKQIAAVVDKRHDNVKRTIETLVKQAVIVQPQIEDEQSIDAMGRTRTEKVYQVNERDSYVVVAQLCPAETAKLVDYWLSTKNQAIKPMAALPTDYIEALEHLLIAKKAEKLAIAERDHAIATKAQIGSKREATAMARASAESRRANSLEIQLDQARDYASVKKIEATTKRKFEWKPLKHWSVEHGIAIKKTTDANYEKGVNTYSSSAWLAVYGVDIYALEVTA